MSTQDKIISVARREFARYGLAGARVDRIARNAGINKAMIYYHFRSKEMLYQAVIDDHMAQIAKFIKANLKESVDPEDFFTDMAKFLDSLFQSRSTFVPIMLREIAGGGGRITRAMTRIVSRKGAAMKIKKMIEAGKRKGVFRNIDSKSAMISFIGMNIFYLMMVPQINTVWGIKNDKKFRRIRPKEIVELFLYGLKAR